ncbi:MAG: metallophosphoesterase [Oscillospiraceae bacterium]|jgi:3',5'-cyclic AMP phosphodiesterase CpdA|nr:metallophosphoesterase [Oscillospiraceae bacterium]
MTTIIRWAAKAFGWLLSVLLAGFIYAPQGPAITPAAPESVKLQFAVMSDVHMESYTLDRFTGFGKSLRDAGKAVRHQDALVLLGDNTMNGQPFEYLMLYGLLARFPAAKQTIVAMGNHDLNQSTYEPADAIARHNRFLASLTGVQYKNPYYSTVIDGYWFIVLGDEDGHEDTTTTITQTQLDWLRYTLSQAGVGGKPVFVFCHQPLNGTFDRVGLGDASDAVWEMLRQYRNVFFFSGHLHTPAGQLSIQQKEGVTFVDLPTLLSDSLGRGVGYQVEVYGGRVLLRGRNYIKGTWVDALHFEIPIQ